MSRLSLEDVIREIQADDEGFARMLSDLGITQGELAQAGIVSAARALFIYAEMDEDKRPNLSELLASSFAQGAIVGIIYARKRDNVAWLTPEGGGA